MTCSSTPHTGCRSPGDENYSIKVSLWADNISQFLSAPFSRDQTSSTSQDLYNRVIDRRPATFLPSTVSNIPVVKMKFCVSSVLTALLAAGLVSAGAIEDRATKGACCKAGVSKDQDACTDGAGAAGKCVAANTAGCK